MTELRPGLYESLLTSKLGRQLAASEDLDPELRTVDLAEQPEVLARHIREAAFRTLTAERDPAKRVELVNALLERARTKPTTQLAATHDNCCPSADRQRQGRSHYR